MDKDQKFNAIIIEDSATDEISLNKALKKYTNVTICGAYNNGHDGLEAIRRIRPSLVFLDMELPDMRGLDIIECLDAETLSNCRFIMHTSYADCMLESFRNNAFDFLLKPVQPDDPEKVMQRLQETARIGNIDQIQTICPQWGCRQIKRLATSTTIKPRTMPKQVMPKAMPLV